MLTIFLLVVRLGGYLLRQRSAEDLLLSMTPINNKLHLIGRLDWAIAVEQAQGGFARLAITTSSHTVHLHLHQDMIL